MPIIYVRDNSGANPRKKPKKRIPEYRRDLFVFTTELGFKVTAENREKADRIAAQNLWGVILEVNLTSPKTV